MAVVQCLYKHIIAATSVCLHAGNPLTQQLHVPCKRKRTRSWVQTPEIMSAQKVVTVASLDFGFEGFERAVYVLRFHSGYMKGVYNGGTC